MQHNVVDTALAALLRARMRSQWQSSLGLTAVEFAVDDDGASPLHTLTLNGSGMQWREADPPRPGRLRVRNVSEHDGLLLAGAVVGGGMSTRATTRNVFIPAGGEQKVEVEPIGPRWWGEGPLYPQGWLDPLILALVLQAQVGDQPMASSARTMLWSVAAINSFTRPRAPHDSELHGWLLQDDDGILAAWMTTGTRLPAIVAHEAVRVQPNTGDATSIELVHALRRHLGRGILVPHLIDTAGVCLEVIFLAGGSRLVDVAIAVLDADQAAAALPAGPPPPASHSLPRSTATEGRARRAEEAMRQELDL